MDSLQKETAPELQTPEAVYISTSFDKPDYTENGCGGEEKKSLSEFAIDYHELGMRPIRCGKNKRPVDGKGWQNTNYSLDEIPAVFANAEALGVILGDASGGIVDVDLDRREAVILAPFFLPDTARFDRGVEYSGHRIYKCPGFGSTKKIQMYPKLLPPGSLKAGEKAMLIELRAEKSQTLFPPTQHADGSVCEWRNSLIFNSISKADLVRRVDLIAAVTHLSFYYKEGVRNNLCLSLAGYLLVQAEWPLEKVENFFRALVAVTDDPDLDERLTTLRATAAKIENGEAKILGSGGLREIIGNPLTDKLGDWLRVPGTAGAKNGGSAKITQVQQLIEIVDDQVTLLKSDNKSLFASYVLNDRQETTKIDSTDFKSYLRAQFYEKHTIFAAKSSIEQAIEYAASKACVFGEKVTPAIRIALHDDEVLYIDMADQSGNVAEVSGQGWALIKSTSCPVRFIRPSSMKPLPSPLSSEEGDFHRIFNHLNLQTDEQKSLFTGALLSSFCPKGPYYLLMVLGPAEVGKTTIVTSLRRFIDPSSTPHCRLPKNSEDLAIVAGSNWLLNIDNVSRISQTVSDDLCRLATGGGLSVRKFYTNDEVFNLNVCRPVILNGIDSAIEREDLVTRTINLTLSPISNHKAGFLPQHILLQNLESDGPAIFAGILNALVKAMTGLKSNNMANSRMANIANWIAPAEEALGWPKGTFANYQAETQRDAMSAALQNDPLLNGLFELAKEMATQGQYFCGSYKQLQFRLDHRVPFDLSQKRFGMSVGRQLNKFGKSLRSVGVTLRRHPTPRDSPICVILISDEMKAKFPNWESGEITGKRFGLIEQRKVP